MKKGWPLLISILIIFAVLEILAIFDLLNTQLVPPTSLVFRTFWGERTLFIESFLHTLVRVLSGFLLSAVIGIALSLCFSLSVFLRRAVLPLSVFFQTVPIIALAPLLVIYFGFGDSTVIVSAFIVSLFPILANTISGLDQVTQEQLELFKVYRASSLQILFKLKLPMAYNSIFAGLKIASGLGIIGAIAGEFVAGGGLGALIDSARTQQRVDQVFVCLYLLSCMGVFMLVVIHTIDNLFQKLRPYGRGLKEGAAL